MRSRCCRHRQSVVEAESFESWYSWFRSFLPQWFMIPTRIFSRFKIHTHWLNDFLSGNLVSFCTCVVPWCSNFSFIETRYHHSFRLDIGFFITGMNIKHQTGEGTGKASWLSAPNARITDTGFWEHDPPNVPPRKFLKIGISETPYPAFHGSNATNLYVYFVKLSFGSHYSWFSSRSTKIHHSLVFKRRCMILTCFVTMIYDSWFRFHPPTDKGKVRIRKACSAVERAFRLLRMSRPLLRNYYLQ